MQNEFTAIVYEAEGGGYWATCLEVPGANAQGETEAQVLDELQEGIRLMLEARREGSLKQLQGESQT